MASPLTLRRGDLALPRHLAQSVALTTAGAVMSSTATPLTDTKAQATECGGLLGWLLLASVLQLVLAMLALLCAAVVAVTAWHLPRSFTVAMVLGLLSGAVALGCIAAQLSMRKWQSGAWRRCVVVAVVVCGVGQLCGVAMFGVNVDNEEAPQERSALLALLGGMFFAKSTAVIILMQRRKQHDVKVSGGVLCVVPTLYSRYGCDSLIRHGQVKEARCPQRAIVISDADCDQRLQRRCTPSLSVPCSRTSCRAGRGYVSQRARATPLR
jgi:hypothetical protein